MWLSPACRRARTRTPAAPQLSSYYSSEVLAPIGGETLPG
jgi:hypothetical protein